MAKRRSVVRAVAGLGITAGCLAAGVGLSSATMAPETPPWVTCDPPDVPEIRTRQTEWPCRVSVPDLPEEILVLDVNGEVVGAVDARLLFRPPAPSTGVHENTGDQYHPEDPPLEVFGPSDEVVGIVDNTGFVPEEEIP